MRGPALATVVVVPVGEDGRVLLLRRTSARGGFWQPVTGRIEPGENPLDAAARELREETGADAPLAVLRYRHAFALDPDSLGRRDGVPDDPSLQFVEESAFSARFRPATPAVSPRSTRPSGGLRRARRSRCFPSRACAAPSSSPWRGSSLASLGGGARRTPLRVAGRPAPFPAWFQQVAVRQGNRWARSLFGR